MADTTTTNYGFTKPEQGASADTWGAKLNANWDAADTQIKANADAAAANASAITTINVTSLPGKQPVDATLTSIAALGTAANKALYTTAADTWAEMTVTAAGRALLGNADAAAQRATLDASQSPLDEDDFASDSATRPPSQQSTKAYVDGAISSAPIIGQTPEDVDSARTGSTWYQNTSDRMMFVTSNRRSSFSSTPRDVEITDNQSSPGAGFPMVVSKTSTQDSPRLMYSFLVPPGHYWRWSGGMEGVSGATYTVEYK